MEVVYCCDNGIEKSVKSRKRRRTPLYIFYIQKQKIHKFKITMGNVLNALKNIEPEILNNRILKWI